MNNASMSLLADPLEVAERCITTNPRLSFFLLRERPLLGVYGFEIEFASGAEGVAVEGALPSTLGEDFYLHDLRSQVSRPNAFAGNIFKAQSDVHNAMNSNIAVKLQVTGGRPGGRYLINENFGALELIAPNVQSPRPSIVCGRDFVLEYTQSLKASMMLRRTYAQGELPLRVEISLLGFSLGCKAWDNITEDAARAGAVELLTAQRQARAALIGGR